MHYEIKELNGNVIVAATDWKEMMQIYRNLRKTNEEPIILEKVDESERTVRYGC
jgi:flagellar biosynthesis GTPase FlhF